MSNERERELHTEVIAMVASSSSSGAINERTRFMCMQ